MILYTGTAYKLLPVLLDATRYFPVVNLNHHNNLPFSVLDFFPIKPVSDDTLVIIPKLYLVFSPIACFTCIVLFVGALPPGLYLVGWSPTSASYGGGRS